MILVLVAIALGANYFEGDIKNIESVSVYLESPKIDYQLTTLDSDDSSVEDELNYQPVVSSFTGASISTKYFTLGWSLQSQDDDLEELEESSLFDLQFYGNYQRLMWEVYYQNYQGLYITNDDEIDDTNLPSANSFSYGFSLRKFTKDDFDPDKSLGAFTKERKIDWSWLYGVYYNKSRLESGDGLIPTEYNAQFDQFVGLTGIETASLGADFGAAGLYHWENFYVSVLFTFGYHLQEQIFNGIDQDDRYVTGLGSNVYFESGYGVEHTFGVQGYLRTLNMPLKNGEYRLGRTNVKVFYRKFF